MAFTQDFLDALDELDTYGLTSLITHASRIEMEEIVLLLDDDGNGDYNNEFDARLRSTIPNSTWGQYLHNQYPQYIHKDLVDLERIDFLNLVKGCLLYTSDAADE